MHSQSKQDLFAAAAILLMFIGAFLLSVSSLGLVLMAFGALGMILLVVIKIRATKQ